MPRFLGRSYYGSALIAIQAVYFVGALATTRSVDAEFFFDFSLGTAFSQSARVEVSDDTTFPTTIASERTSFDPSAEVAFRFGGWFEPLTFMGMGVDCSYFTAEGGPVVENHIFPLSTLLLFRIPLLQTRNHPYGQLQPYFGVGPSLVFSDSVIDLRPEVDEHVDAASVDLGLDVRAGLAWEFVPHCAFFAEYKFLYFEQNLEETNRFGFFEGLNASAETTYLTHHVMFGISLRF